jgi:hypothetical protein
MVAFRKRVGTLQIHSESKDLEVKVRDFQCHDETTLGKHHKKWNWTFDIGESTQEWELKVDEAVVGKKLLHFTVDGKDVFKDKMQEDFEHELPVRGTLNLDRPYEVKSMEFDSSDQWYPATLTLARGDGRYEAELFMPPDRCGKQKKLCYPLVEANQIRDPFTKEVVQVPSTTVRLFVNKDAALLPELTINGLSFTRYFCVSSLAANTSPAEIDFTVSEDRTNVTADVGHGKLKEALDGKVRSKTCQKSKLKCEWKIQTGGFDEHHIVVQTKSKSSKEVNISIDGHRVVGGSAADLACTGWCADIAIQSKLALKYNLHRNNASGAITDEVIQTTTVTKNLLRCNTIKVSVPDHSNLETAMLECDGVDFSDLEWYKVLPPESMIDDSLETLEMTHGLSVPYAIGDESSTSGFVSELTEMVPGWDSACDFTKLFPAWGSASHIVQLIPGGVGLGKFFGSQHCAIEDKVEAVDNEIPEQRIAAVVAAAQAA